MNQGDIYLINLDPALHTEASKIRPGIIISINAMNQYSPRLIIAPITSNIGKVYPFEVFITRGVGGLEKDSKIMLDQIRSLDKRRLVKKIGAINKEMLVKVCLVAQKLISAE
ncbi:MAG: type II toxin-antitoxin system PemK/MazF family toxin [Deltaproteobacteria bacterium]|nr:type II toxin-antitoxin system PemK/MazF family toxin [Deltaproteobacteria bacterium]